jgi:hypothetical protein
MIYKCSCGFSWVVSITIPEKQLEIKKQCPCGLQGEQVMEPEIDFPQC